MNCCKPTIVPFINVDTLNIPYSAAMRVAYGNVPTVKVYHKDGEEYINAFISVGFVGTPTTQINIGNGGVATGFVKITR